MAATAVPASKSRGFTEAGGGGDGPAGVGVKNA